MSYYSNIATQYAESDRLDAATMSSRVEIRQASRIGLPVLALMDLNAHEHFCTKLPIFRQPLPEHIRNNRRDEE